MLSRYNTAPEKIALLAESLSCCVSLPILWHYGRIRTNAPTPRTGKPQFLQQQPNLEILNLLQFVLADYGEKDDFFFVQIDAEGMDYQIIRSIDFQRIKPAIIRYEHMVLHERDRDACLELLEGHGCRFLLEDSDTTAYLGRSPLVSAG